MKDEELFFKTFANVPIPERSNPIYVDSQYGAMSWYVVNLEVRAGSEVGLRAIKFMKQEKFI